MSVKPFKLVVFDWDGTLMDSVSFIVHCLGLTIDELGLEPRSEERCRDVIGLGLGEAVRALYPGTDAAFERAFVDSYRAHYLRPETLPTPLFPGAAEVVHRLHRNGYTLAVATGKGRRGLDRVLAETGLGELFEHTRCADETRSKPHPQMLLEIMAASGARPEETLMIGDTEWDLAMAAEAGTASLGVSYGVHDCERLGRHRPLACLDAITELPAWLDAAA